MKQPTKMEVVYLPSAHSALNPEKPDKGYAPGGRFMAFTSDAIRRRNIERWKHTPHQEKKAATTEATAEAVKAAFASAQGGSLVHRSVRKEAA